MKNQQLQQSENQLLNNSKFRNLSIMYLDIVIRSLISFLCVGVLFSIILIGYLHISWVFVLPLVFFVSIIISPLLMKIRLGEIVFLYYEDLLHKIFKLDK